MNINYLEIYRLFTIVGTFFYIKQIVLVCSKPKNCMYHLLPLVLIFAPWFFANYAFIQMDISPPIGLDEWMHYTGNIIILSIALAMQICMVILIYLFHGKYVEFHITYLPRTRRKHIRVDLDESYIIFYGLTKFKKTKIFVRDIIVEESYYGTFIEDTKIFRFAAALGSEDYFVFKLQNGKIVKIKFCPFFLYGDIFGLDHLSYALGIPQIKSLHKKPR